MGPWPHLLDKETGNTARIGRTGTVQNSCSLSSALSRHIWLASGKEQPLLTGSPDIDPEDAQL